MSSFKYMGENIKNINDIHNEAFIYYS